jgi:hypothetical protein
LVLTVTGVVKTVFLKEPTALEQDAAEKAGDGTAGTMNNEPP